MNIKVGHHVRRLTGIHNPSKKKKKKKKRPRYIRQHGQIEKKERKWIWNQPKMENEWNGEKYLRE